MVATVAPGPSRGRTPRVDEDTKPIVGMIRAEISSVNQLLKLLTVDQIRSTVFRASQ